MIQSLTVLKKGILTNGEYYKEALDKSLLIYYYSIKDSLGHQKVHFSALLSWKHI